MEKPSVLVVGINPWVDNSGINTLINIFDSWDANKLSHIYTREGLPCTSICNNFFQISETRILKRLLGGRTIVGQAVFNTPSPSPAQSQESSKRKFYKSMGMLGVLARELIWKIGRWDDANLKSYLDEFNPDVLFLPTYNNVYMSRLQNFIADYTGKPIILYASDDNFSYKSVKRSPLSMFHRYLNRCQQRKLFNRASRVMVIAPKAKEEYDYLFGCDCAIMTKGIDFSNQIFRKKMIGYPIKIVYTGKLIYGRWKSLEAVSISIERLNRSGTAVEFDVYTTDPITNKIAKAFKHEGTSLKGAIPMSKIAEVLDASDIVVFAESLEPDYKNLARLSLSTKVTDYLCSGRCIFAIGDHDIAPIDYLRRNDAAVIATNYTEIDNTLSNLIKEPHLISEYGRKAYDCGKRNHSKERQRQILEKTINSVL